MYHSFQVELAEQYGIPAAIMLEHIAFWGATNEANGINLYDGRYWTFNSVSAFQRIYPYLTQNAIRAALERLVDEGLVVTGNYNKDKRDRTMWYALTDFGKELTQKTPLHFQKTENEISENQKCIHYNNYKHSYKQSLYSDKFQKPTLDEVRQYCQERGSKIDPEAFYAHYESNGWKVGKNPMKNWKMAVVTWERSGLNTPKKKEKTFADMYREMKANETA